MGRKGLLSVWLSLICLLSACSSGKMDTVSVQGTITNLGRSELHLSYFAEKNLIAFDTIYSNETGKFEFQINSTKEITPITIYFKKFNCWTTLFAQAGDKIDISGNIDLVDLLTIKGGKVNDDLARFKQEISLIYQERQQIINGKYKNGGEDVDVRLADINLILKRKAKEFIIENPTLFASVVLIQDFFYQEYDTNTIELLNLLKGEAQNNYLTDRLKEGVKHW